MQEFSFNVWLVDELHLGQMIFNRLHKGYLMKRSHFLSQLAFLFISIAAPFGTVWAIPITVDFTASDFTALEPGAPVDPISGTIVYEAASTTADIDSLISISLSIDGHTYSVDELGFSSPIFPPEFTQFIGGSISGSTGVTNNTNDFVISWHQTDLTGISFIYTSASTSGIWKSVTFDSFSVSAVPVPASIWLLGSGLISLVGIARRRKS